MSSCMGDTQESPQKIEAGRLIQNSLLTIALKTYWIIVGHNFMWICLCISSLSRNSNYGAPNAKCRTLLKAQVRHGVRVLGLGVTARLLLLWLKRRP